MRQQLEFNVKLAEHLAKVTGSVIDSDAAELARSILEHHNAVDKVD